MTRRYLRIWTVARNLGQVADVGSSGLVIAAIGILWRLWMRRVRLTAGSSCGVKSHTVTERRVAESYEELTEPDFDLLGAPA